jgi:hypothetical protein
MRWILFFGLVFFSIQGAWAQRDIEEQDMPSVWDRIYFGGGGNLQFGQNYFVVGASPLVGYMISPKFSTGLGATYLFTRYGGVYNYNSHTYGGRTFARYNLLKSVYTMAEYEMLSFDNFRSSSEAPRIWVDRLLFGGGYFQSLGRRGGFNIGILYDVLYRPGVAYNSPWVYRVGFTF